jgi:hypothetical protein
MTDPVCTATSALNILIDIFILILPLPLILSIQRPVREKSALLAIFALGAFSCIASIVRLYSVRVFTMVRPPTSLIAHPIFLHGVHNADMGMIG